MRRPDNASRAALALAAAMALMEVLGTASPTPDAASSRARPKLREDGQVPANALEALAAEVAELVLGDSASHTLVLAEPDPARSATLQARFLADGMPGAAGRLDGARPRAAGGGEPGAGGGLALPDGEAAALTRSLRAEAPTAELPIFILAPPEDPGLVEAGLDAGADDVLTYPVNPDVLAAKLRRALQPAARSPPWRVEPPACPPTWQAAPAAASVVARPRRPRPTPRSPGDLGRAWTLQAPRRLPRNLPAARLSTEAHPTAMHPPTMEVLSILAPRPASSRWPCC